MRCDQCANVPRKATPDMIRVRRYQALDLANCLRVFDANVPKHFGISERPEFARFLGERPDYFLVAEQESRLSACGGIEMSSHRGIAEFRWVMVAPGAQGSGLGRLLLLLSAEWYFRCFDVRVVLAYTTPESAGFFRRLGFDDTTLRVDKNYWAPGLDLEVLRLDVTGNCASLTDKAVARLLARELELESGIRVA